MEIPQAEPTATPISGDGSIDPNTEPTTGIDPQNPAAQDPPPAPAGDPDDDDLPHGVKKRIGKLTARLHGQEAYVQSLEQQIAQLQAATQPQAPNWDDLPIEEQVKMLARQEAQAILQQERSQLSAKQQQQQIVENFQSQLSDLETRVPQAREIIAEAEPFFAQIGSAAQMQILGSAHAADIAFELAQNPNLALQIARMSPEQKAKTIDRMEIKIELRKEMQGITAQAPAAQAQSQAPQRTPAQPTPQANKGATIAPAVNPDDMSFEQYKQWRKTTAKKR